MLLVLGVNRFFLSSLSVALPHVVAEDKLVMANSVSPTIGGISATIGGIVALGLNVATGNTERGAAITLLFGGACYVAASLVAATMARDRLGPARPDGRRGHRRHAGRCSASSPRSRPGWPTAPATSSGGAARRRRSAPPAASAWSSGRCS